MSYPANALTKPMVLPEWDTGNLVLFTPSRASSPAGAAVANPKFTVSVSGILNNPKIIPPFTNSLGNVAPYIANPNACALFGPHLFFTNNSSDNIDGGVVVQKGSQAIIVLPNYLRDGAAVAMGNAFVLDSQGSLYIGLTFDASGTLYASVSFGGGFQITVYQGAGAATQAIAPAALTLSNDDASANAEYGDLALDAGGNLWASDRANNRLVVVANASLLNPPAGGANWATLVNGTKGPLAVSNFPGQMPPATVANLLVGPEGVDFDGFGGTGNLWVANNNDGYTGLAQNEWTSLARIPRALQAQLVALLGTGGANSISTDTLTAGTDYSIFAVPTYTVPDGQKPQLGGLQVDRSANRLYVNDEVGGWVRGYDLGTIAQLANTPGDTGNQIAANDVTSQSGNGGLALVQLGCYVMDDTSDTGSEPDTTDPTAWESLSIVATETTGPQTTLPAATFTDATLGFDGSDEVVGGDTTCQIYVQVNYTSAMPTTGLDQLHLYWAKASSTLGWPAPWDGSATDPGTGAPMGGSIGSPITLPATAASGTTYIAGPVPWTPPNPMDYTSQDGHFCLLARIATPNTLYAEADFAGMTTPEQTDITAGNDNLALTDNVLNNARIAWRNIHILKDGTDGKRTPPHFHPFPPSVVVGRLGRVPLEPRIGFELLDERGQVVPAPGGALRLSATGRSLALLERASLGRLPSADSRRADYRCGPVPDLEAGITGLRLPADELLVFHVEYEAPEPRRDYAIRVTAHEKTADGERRIGGQTFVYGKVEGFSAPRRHTRG